MDEEAKPGELVNDKCEHQWHDDPFVFVRNRQSMITKGKPKI